MTKAIRRRVPDEQGPPELSRMIRRWDLDWRANVSPELVARRHFVGPSERVRRKQRRALRRARRDANRAA